MHAHHVSTVAFIVLALLVSPASVRLAHAAGCGSPPLGVVAWYPGEGDAADKAGGNDGTLQGGTAFADGIYGRAFSLDGVDSFVSAPSTSEIDPTEAGSIGAWVRFDELPSAAGHIMEVVGKGSGGNDFDLQADTDDRFGFYVAAGARARSTTVIETGRWYYVVGAWDAASGISLYVNGVLEGENAAHVTRSATGWQLELGNQPFFGPRLLAGAIDEAQIYDLALAGVDVADFYAACTLCGDANADGDIKASDALVVLRNAVELPSPCPSVRCDVNDGGSIVATDALNILQRSVGLDVELACPLP